MQRFTCLLTNLIFGAHALIGCNPIHAWSHGFESNDSAAAQPADHNSLADHRDNPLAPANNNEDPAHPDQHDSCSFVKASTVRIDRGDSHVSWLTALTPPNYGPVVHASHAACEPILNANFDSAQLYVWHCALLI